MKDQKERDKRIIPDLLFTVDALSLLLSTYGVPTARVKGDTPVHCCSGVGLGLSSLAVKCNMAELEKRQQIASLRNPLLQPLKEQ